MKTSRLFWNKIRKHRPKLIAALAVIIITVVSIYFTIGQGKLKSDEVNKPVSQIIQPPVSEQNSNAGLESAADKKTENEVLTAQPNISPMPVLMYHYIRDLNDPSDKVGTNLSVSPEKFAAQLDLIQSKGYETVTFNDIETGKLPQKPIILTFDDGYKDFYKNAYPELKKRGMKAVSYIITNKIGADGYMDQAEIKEISGYGIEIGSHTLSHPDLSKLTDAKSSTEIIRSKQILEELTQIKVISFCYPSGKYTEDTEKLIKASEYKYAVTTKGGIASFVDYFALNRYRVNPDTNIGTFIK